MKTKPKILDLITQEEIAAYIISHGLWRKMRGKKPSLSFMDEKNPAQALMMAEKMLNDQTLYYLKWARHTTDSNENRIAHIRNYCKTFNLPLSKIGTSEEELDLLLKKGYLAEAKNWLSSFRKKSDYYDLIKHDAFIIKFLKLAGATLEDIGSCDDEIDTLKKIGYALSAKRVLNTYKSLAGKGYADMQYEHNVKIIKEYLLKAGSTVFTIGTSEEELTALSKGELLEAV